MSSLAVTSLGTGPRLVALHGFTQDASLWAPLAPWLTRDRELCSVDLPGHGKSTGLSMDLAQAADAVAQLAETGPIDLVGYSLGARVALLSALAHPTDLRRLVLISGTAGIDDQDERMLRRHSDEALADDLEASGDLAGFLDNWLATPMFAALGDAAGLEARLSNTPHGLADSLRRMGTGTMTPCWESLANVSIPVLVLAGSQDTKFVNLAERLVAGLPNAELAVIAGVGHACHLEAPERVGALIDEWLSSTN